MPWTSACRRRSIARAAESAFAAEKHVFLEKPIALTLEDADAIVAAVDRSGRSLMVGLVLRFWPEYVELRRRVAAGELGRPLAVSTFRLSPPADWNDWMIDPRQSGGVPVDLLIHDFDQMNWLLGAPRRVYARAPVPGHVLSIVEYDGAQGIAEGSMTMPKSYPFSSNIRVLCEGGTAEYGFNAAPAEDGGNIGASDAPRGLRLYPRDAEPVTVPVESADPWGPELEYFVECLERGRKPEQGTGEQARLALALSLAATRSLESGRAEQSSRDLRRHAAGRDPAPGGRARRPLARGARDRVGRGGVRLRLRLARRPPALPGRGPT